MRKRSRRTAALVVCLAGTAAIAGGAVALGNDVSPEEIFRDQRNEESKEAIAAEDALLQAYDEQHPAPVPEDPEEAGPEPDPADFVWEVGIFEDAEFPAGLGFTFENRWQGHIDGWHVNAYAGSYSDDPEDGVILIQLKDLVTWGNKFAGPFESPLPGPQRIERAKGTVLTISSAAGERVIFDVATRQFG